MIIEYIKSVIENVRDRLKNPFNDTNKTPFAGAFIIALLIYNWELVYTLINFDSWENRQQKIEIIKQYLGQKSWYNRIGWSLGISFVSIIFFYFFNYISLGITTFFRRWFKGIILYYTDKSQVMPRDEHELYNQKANSIKRQFEELKERTSKIEDENNELSTQLTNLTSQFSTVTNEKEELKKELEQHQLSLRGRVENENSFRVIYSQYGAENSFEDVTKAVSDLLKKNNRFTVDNKSLGIDPIKYSVKNLLIIYEMGKTTKKIMANEEEEIEFKDNELVVTQTEKSRLKQTYIENTPKLADIFKGQWTLTSVKPGGTHKETVLIDRSGNYFSNNNHVFFIKTIQIDTNSNKIKFNKVSLQRTLHSKEDLTILDPNHIKGVDSLGYTLDYQKIK